jgi:hypothetical protein
VVIGVVFLHESIVPLSQDLACLVVDDHRANGAPALVKTLSRQPDGDAQKIAVAQFFEETSFGDGWKTPRGDIRDRVEDSVGDGGIPRD